MEISFYGAVRTVTGSMHMLHVGGQQILLDCGLYQGRRAEAYARNSNFPFHPHDIETALLSHAHIDHSGNLPSLVKKGFRGQIVCTAATRDLAAVMLRDSGDIQVSDVEFVNKRRAENHEPPVTPLYRPDDVERTIRRLVGYGYDRPFEVARGVSLTFHDAGHILGSAISVLDAREDGEHARICYSGDLGRRGAPILRDPEIVANIDYLIVESTYGDRVHGSLETTSSQLTRIIKETAERGGHVMIASFAVGRTQEIVYALNKQMQAGALPRIPIYVDSPLALDATEVFRLHSECFDRETRTFMLRYDDPFGFRQLHYVRSVEESKQLNDMTEPFVVIAASGMLESGRMLHHLRHGIEDARNTVVLVSYQAPDTLGRRLAEGAQRVHILGDEFAVQAHVEKVEGFSAHADQDDLLWWIGQMRGLRKVFVVHSDEEVAETFAALLRQQGSYEVVAPKRGQSIEL